jgi:hypothetical protein
VVAGRGGARRAHNERGGGGDRVGPGSFVVHGKALFIVRQCTANFFYNFIKFIKIINKIEKIENQHKLSYVVYYL